MVDYVKSKAIFLDVIFLTTITILSLFFISFYFSAPNLDVTYADWMVQAFRVKTLELYGPISWTHMWSNGIELWKSYQFIPHVITLGVAKYAGVDVPRAMVLVVIAQFVLLRVITYIVARLLKFSPFTALFASLATFSIAYFWKAVGDYSLLFSFTFFPIMLLFWVKYLEGKLQWFYPYLSGLMFYIHPILGVTSIGLWGIGQFFAQTNIFSRKTFIELFLFLLSSSLFWVPIIFKQSYTNSTVYLATKEFLQLSLAPFSYLGLSLILFVFLTIGLGQLFFPISQKYKWSKILFIFVGLFLGLIYAGVQISLPSFINQFQYTRGIGLIGIGIIFCILPLIETLQKFKSFFVKGILVAVLTATVVEGMWITSYYSPDVLNSTTDPVKTFFSEKKINPSSERIWTSTIDLTSYYGADTATRIPTSYMAHLESNHLPERLNQLITYRPFLSQIPASELPRINDYFMLTGTKYVFLEEGSPYVATLKEKSSGYKNLDQVVVSGGIYEVFETPWKTRNAVLISDVFKNSLISFPNDLRFDKIADQISLDSQVKTFTKTIYDPINLPLPIQYPSQDSLTVEIPPNSTSNTVFINESYNKQWKAYLNGNEQEIKSVGPNFMLVTLQNAQSGGTLTLRHEWPQYYYFLLVGIPFIPFIMWTIKLILSFRQRSSRSKLFHKASSAMRNQGTSQEFVNLLHRGATV